MLLKVLPKAAKTAGEVKFSLAINCKPPRARSNSLSNRDEISGSCFANESQSGPQKVLFPIFEFPPQITWLKYYDTISILGTMRRISSSEITPWRSSFISPDETSTIVDETLPGVCPPSK